MRQPVASRTWSTYPRSTVAAQLVLERVVGLGVAQAEIDGAVQALPEALLERDDLEDVHEVDLDRRGRADDAQVGRRGGRGKNQRETDPGETHDS